MTAIEIDRALHNGIPIYKLSTQDLWNHQILTLVSTDNLAFCIPHHHIPENLQSIVALFLFSSSNQIIHVPS